MTHKLQYWSPPNWKTGRSAHGIFYLNFHHTLWSMQCRAFIENHLRILSICNRMMQTKWVKQNSPPLWRAEIYWVCFKFVFNLNFNLNHNPIWNLKLPFFTFTNWNGDKIEILNVFIFFSSFKCIINTRSSALFLSLNGHIEMNQRTTDWLATTIFMKFNHF